MPCRGGVSKSHNGARGATADVADAARNTAVVLVVLTTLALVMQDTLARGLGVSNGRFVSFLDSLASVISFRDREPVAAAATTSSSSSSPASSSSNHAGGPRKKGIKPENRRKSVFALNSKKNTKERFAYVWLASFVLKFLGGTLLSIVLFRTPVLFHGLRHYVSFFTALVLVQFSPNDVVFETVTSSAGLRTVIGCALALHKYRKAKFALQTMLAMGHNTAFVLLSGMVVVEINSWIRTAENYLSNWPWRECATAAPSGALRALLAPNSLLSLAASAAILVSVRVHDASWVVVYASHIVAVAALLWRYNRKHVPGVKRSWRRRNALMRWNELTSWHTFSAALEAVVRGLWHVVTAATLSLAGSIVVTASWVGNRLMQCCTADAAVAAGHRVVWFAALVAIGRHQLDMAVTFVPLWALMALLYPTAVSHLAVAAANKEQRQRQWLQAHAFVVLCMLAVEKASFDSGVGMGSTVSDTGNVQASGAPYDVLRAFLVMWSGDPVVKGAHQIGSLLGVAVTRGRNVMMVGTAKQRTLSKSKSE